jgi:hypothetical protein
VPRLEFAFNSMRLEGFYSHYYLTLGVFFLFVWYLLLSDYSPEISASPWFSRYASAGAAKTRRVKLHHPIPTLMDEAQRVYHRKLDGQSKTLIQAVTEYKKRYNRDPPRGFDDWWAFAKYQNFTMMDEFDSLVADLEPFWSLSPEELRRRTSQVRTLAIYRLHILCLKFGVDGQNALCRSRPCFQGSCLCNQS